MASIKKWESEDHWVEIDLDKCVGAADCIEVCPAEVFELVNGKVIAENIGACTDCRACEGICPTNAIINHSAW